MRTALVLVREHGKDAFELLSGPSDYATEAKAYAQTEAQCSPAGDFAEVQLWVSDHGIYRYRKSLNAKEAQAQADKAAADLKAHEASQVKAQANIDRASKAALAPIATPPAPVAVPPVIQAPASAPAQVENW